MKEVKIFFDMDGVLVDFEGGVKEFLNIDIYPQNKKPSWYDDLLFSKIKEYKNFYKVLRPIKEGVELYHSLVSSFGLENVEILTGVPKPSRGIPEAPQNKIDWIREHISTEVKVNPVLRKEKPNFITSPYSVLIDDYDKNIKEWNKAGGKGFLFSVPKYESVKKSVFEFLGG